MERTLYGTMGVSVGIFRISLLTAERERSEDLTPAFILGPVLNENAEQDALSINNETTLLLKENIFQFIAMDECT